MLFPFTRSRIRNGLRSVLFSASCLAAVTGFAQNARQLIQQGDSLLQLEKPQRALDHFERAVEIESTATTHLARARAWYMLDRMDRFLLDVDKALRLDSSSGEDKEKSALYALRAEDYGLAESQAGQAIS